MDKVLVTGGLGNIGASVCRALLATSRQPVIYDMGGSSELIRDIAADCVVESGNICDMPRIMGIVAQHKPVAIAHLAGQPSQTVEQLPWSALNTNLLGATTIFEVARLTGVPRVVFPSSRQVYGPVGEQHRHPTYDPVTEEHPREPPKLYGKIKRACEDVADHYARLYGLDIIALRFGSSFGRRQHARMEKMPQVTGLIEAAIDNQPFRIESGAEQCSDFCYSGEATNGLVAALDSVARPGKFRAYNIASGELISLREMLTILKDLYPSWSAEAGPGLDYRGRGTAYYFRMSIQKAQSELDFKPRFDFRRAAIDCAEKLAHLKKATS